MPASYFSKEDLAARVGGMDALTLLVHDTGATDEQDTAVLAGLVDGVCSEADGYFLSGGYPVPLPSGLIPKVRNTLLDISAYRAKTRGERDASDDERTLFKTAMLRLGEIASKDFVLLEATTPSTENLYSIDSAPALFDRKSLQGF